MLELIAYKKRFFSRINRTVLPQYARADAHCSSLKLSHPGAMSDARRSTRRIRQTNLSLSS